MVETGSTKREKLVPVFYFSVSSPFHDGFKMLRVLVSVGSPLEGEVTYLMSVIVDPGCKSYSYPSPCL